MKNVKNSITSIAKSLILLFGIAMLACVSSYADVGGAPQIGIANGTQRTITVHDIKNAKSDGTDVKSVSPYDFSAMSPTPTGQYRVYKLTDAAGSIDATRRMAYKDSTMKLDISGVASNIIITFNDDGWPRTLESNGATLPFTLTRILGATLNGKPIIYFTLTEQQ